MFDLPVPEVSPALAFVFGTVLLFAGRRLYWLFVGVVGFLLGLSLAFNVLELESRGLELLVALLAGGLGISLALALQKVAVALAGFIVGGYGLHAVLFGNNATEAAGSAVFSSTEILVFLAGGVIAAVLAGRIFGGALVVMTSLSGAALITQGADLEGETAALTFGLLFALGVAFQLGFGRRVPKRGRRAEDYDD